MNRIFTLFYKTQLQNEKKEKILLALGLILCSKKKILEVELRDFSQAEKEITACKAEQIHRMTPIFTQNVIQGLF